MILFRHIVHALIQQTAFKIYRGYATLREAERVWALANGIGSARALNAISQAIGLPSGPFPSLEDGDDYEGADWFTVIKGRIPGIYPVWYVSFEHLSLGLMCAMA